MQFNYKYGGNSNVNSNAKAVDMSFAPDTLRQPTFFVGKLHKKIAFREAISALHDVVVSDLRFKPKDKTAYKAWAAEQEQIWLAEYMSSFQIGQVKERIEAVKQELRVVREEKDRHLAPFMKARKRYYDYLYEKDRDAWFVLDPVITIHPDEVFFECFSQDESTYGKLSANYNVFKEINTFECGTTNIDYSAALYGEFQKVRDYKETDFKIDPSGFEVQTGNDDTYKEIKIDLPDSWVRGFLQVSAAMTLPATTFDLHPLDMFSICQILRRFKEKVSPRSLKFILVPNQPVKVIFEPWNKELVFYRSIFKGEKAQEIRLWGRRRLLTLERLIPIAKRFRVSLMGTGLPSFFMADLGDMTYTLGLSGWTANDWSRAGNFDLMAPRAEVDNFTKTQIFNALKQNWLEKPEDLARRLGMDSKTVFSALSAYTQAGSAIYDLNLGVYRVRELSREPLPMDKLRFSSPQEEAANKLLKESKVTVKGEQEGKLLKLRGLVKEANKTYHTTLSIDADERMIEATCECNLFQMNKLRKVPCEHILATRMSNL
ncbi:MAG: SWIM zinc finger domain-containing protein [Thermoflexibacter sp.]|nr:SWIM zinc finger domain-containing protein [Thermoflexibacter sp.]